MRVAPILVIALVTGLLPGRADASPPGVTAPDAVASAAALPPLPARWPFRTFQLGMTDPPGGARALRAAAPFALRYEYLAGGVNTGRGWTTWNPDGAYVTRYVSDSLAAGVTPVFSYYQIRHSRPGDAMAEPAGMFANLDDAGTMRDYWLDVETFMKRAGAFASPVILHLEPDLWGYAQQRGGDDAGATRARVASTGLPALAGLGDDLRSFARAALRLRDLHAPNVLVAYHLSGWGTNTDISIQDPPDQRVDALGARAGAFYRSLGADFDLTFTDISDRDAAFKERVLGAGASAWWGPEDHRREARFLAAYTASSGQRVVLWQIPLGNTRMRAQNNTWDHYQDVHVEWFLDDPTRAHLRAYADAGVVALLFGRGADGSTCACDDARDGVTDPPPIGGNTLPSLSADDDGGFFKARAAAYYAAGAMPLAAATACDTGGTPTATVHLPNVTKTLGGPAGWVTPFIVQNVGAVPTTLELSFYAFATGSLVACRKVSGLAPSTSFADVPNEDADLPGDSQFSVVVRSFGAPVVAVVNEQRGSGAGSEAMSYRGLAHGATRLHLPNVARRFFGYGTPFIVQNLGDAPATATIAFAAFDGGAGLALVRRIEPGRSVAIDPDHTPGLADGTQYSVTVTADAPVGAVLNASRAGAAPVSYSHDAITSGASRLYAPLVVKRDALGRSSPVVVQNVGTAPARPSLSFTPHASFTLVRTFAGPEIAPGRSWVFDPRFVPGTATPCGAAATATCLADGTYSAVIDAPGAQLAAVVLPTSETAASAYAASPTPAARILLPNVTSRLGGDAGWTTPIVIQSAQASRATLSWRRFSDGALVHTQSVVLPLGEGSAGAVVVDPRETGLPDGQYAVTVDALNGPAVAIVLELASGGDSHMAYEGFALP